jgi:ABC-2 type transport system ATP-binding protein
MATATLRLTRSSRQRDSETTGRPWRVLLDGVAVASLEASGTLEVATEPGHHSLRVALTSHRRSPQRTFDVAEGEVVGFSCRPRSPSPIVFTRWLVWFLVLHDRWIGLERDDATDVAPPVNNDATAIGARDGREATTLSPEVRAAVSAQLATPRSRSGPSVLVVENLTKQFGSRTAFSDVSFDVGYGEVFGFLGPNGAGKTTTVRTLGTLIAPTSGAATVAGIPLLPENGVAIRQKIAIMPESPGLYLRLTVRENLSYFAGLYGLGHANHRINEALEAVNLTVRANDLCGGLSKGLRQRVGLARTLLSEPSLMFLDEPTSGLDPVASLEVLNLILGLKARGVTIFLTTHRLDEAERLCDRVAIMNTKLRIVGSTDELRKQLFKRTLLVTTVTPLEGPTAFFSAVASVEASRVNEDGSYELTVADPRVAAPEVARALVGVGADVLSIAESRHSLEEVYLELIADDATTATL